MPAALPSALRARFQRLIEKGVKRRATALSLNVSTAAGARRAFKCVQRGMLNRNPRGGQGNTGEYRAFLEELIAQDPNITLFDLRDVLSEAKACGSTTPRLTN